MSVKVSICIPAYKQVEYLKKCLDSVVSQKFTDYEIIISDDSPGDEVKKLIEKTLKNKPYRYFHNSVALGSPANWNKAISEASGKYIKVLHHDDFFTSTESLGKMVDAIERSESDFLFCATDVWYTQIDQHRIHHTSAKLLKRIKREPEFLFFKNCIGAPSATIYRRDYGITFDRKLKWLVDIDFYIQYIRASKTVFYIDEPLICTMHDVAGQVTNAVIEDKNIQIGEHVLVFNKIHKQIKEKNCRSFFEYLFRDHNVGSFHDLVDIVPEATDQKDFFMSVFYHIKKNVSWKNFKRKMYKSRYNHYTFKLEQF